MAERITTCPNCKKDLSSYQGGRDPLTFCLFCQFPLVLVAGKYRLLSVLGQGGFGTVYRAEHIQLDRDAERVVKITKPEVIAHQGMRERFWREVQTTSILSQQNPHIVRIYDDFGEIPNLGYYYVMEFLQGQTLTEFVQPSQGLPIPWTLFVFRQLCDAMQAAHEEGIVHRDLKPDNLFLITYRKQEFFLKVLDFGIAKPMEAAPRESGRLTKGIIGTPIYLSPEQAINKDLDHRADIYSMGIILHEMLTGEIPGIPSNLLSSMSFLEILTRRLTSQDPAPPHLVYPELEIPEPLSRAICRALAFQANDRFPTVDAFWKELQPFLPEGPVPSPFVDRLPTGRIEVLSDSKSHREAAFAATSEGEIDTRRTPAPSSSKPTPASLSAQKEPPARRYRTATLPPEEEPLPSPSPFSSPSTGEQRALGEKRITGEKRTSGEKSFSAGSAASSAPRPLPSLSPLRSSANQPLPRPGESEPEFLDELEPPQAPTPPTKKSFPLLLIVGAAIILLAVLALLVLLPSSSTKTPTPNPLAQAPVPPRPPFLPTRREEASVPENRGASSETPRSPLLPLGTAFDASAPADQDETTDEAPEEAEGPKRSTPLSRRLASSKSPSKKASSRRPDPPDLPAKIEAPPIPPPASKGPCEQGKFLLEIVPPSPVEGDWDVLPPELVKKKAKGRFCVSQRTPRLNVEGSGYEHCSLTSFQSSIREGRLRIRMKETGAGSGSDYCLPR